MQIVTSGRAQTKPRHVDRQVDIIFLMRSYASLEEGVNANVETKYRAAGPTSKSPERARPSTLLAHTSSRLYD
jgi:hypothetical protein